MGKAETDHMQRTMMVGSLALLTSRVAEKKAQNAAVKQFAQFEIAEQETVAEVLKSMQSGSQAATTGQKPSDSEAESHLDAEGRQMLQKLQQASGADFDKQYVQGQIDGHKKLLDAQEDYIKAGKNREHVNTAKLARGHIKEHITMLQNMKLA
jgi:predicted outer membrane protein